MVQFQDYFKYLFSAPKKIYTQKCLGHVKASFERSLRYSTCEFKIFFPRKIINVRIISVIQVNDASCASFRR